MIRRLRPFFPAAARDAGLGALVLVAAAGAEVLQPWPIKWLVDFVFGSAAPPAWLHAVAPFLGREHLDASILFICGAVIALAVALKGLALISQQLLIRAGNTLVLQLRSKVCDHLLRLHLGYHDKAKVGDSLYRLAYDTTCLQSLLSQAVAPVATGILVFVGATVVMLSIDPALTAVAVCAAPIYWLAIKVCGHFIGRRSKAYHDNESALAAAATEALSSIRAVRAFTREAIVQKQFVELAARSHGASQRLVFAQLAFGAVVGLAMALGTSAVVYMGAHRVATGALTIGDILVFLAYLGVLYQPMNAISQATSVLHSVRSQLDRVFELLDTQPAIVETPGATAPASVTGRIEFDHVTFGYDPALTVVKKLCFIAEPGQRIAVVGRTGSGKSTLASLLLRFYDPNSGAVLLDGRDLRTLPLTWLRRQIAIVMQEQILFSATIGENIAYANPGASREQIHLAAQRAQAAEFIEALPEGYDTLLGERGVNLSGGQRQRLGIARAFLKDAPILILDEPTSALDAHTEAAFVDTLQELTRGRTTFVIAHRLSTVRSADKIIVLDGGRILESGTHDTLMARDSEYRRLYSAQLGSEPAPVTPAAQ